MLIAHELAKCIHNRINEYAPPPPFPGLGGRVAGTVEKIALLYQS